MTPSSAKIEPMDRSMPPVMMTKPSPIENSPKKADQICRVREVDGRDEARVHRRDRGADHEDQDEEAELLLQHGAAPLWRGAPTASCITFSSLKRSRGR